MTSTDASTGNASWLPSFLRGRERPVRVYDSVTYNDFWDNHLIPNLPLLLSSRNTSDWGARKDWALPDSASSTYLPDNVGASHEGGIQGESSISRPSRPNLKALRVYAKHILPVAHTTKREFSEFERTERELGEVLDIWETQIGMSMTGGLGDGEDDNLVNCKSKELQDHGHGYGEGAEAGLYVKDWHLLDTLEKEGRGAGEIYEVPDCLRDDWLNPPFSLHPRRTTSSLSPTNLPVPPSLNSNTLCPSDFRFTYLGPPGTFTPLHKDVYGSYSWSANVVGRKAWWLFPPAALGEVKRRWSRVVSAHRQKLRTRSREGNGDDGVADDDQERLGELPFDVRDRRVDLDGTGVMRFIQEEGAIIFVPSGWYHQVVNLDFCISINHNFFSSPTLPRIFSALAEAQERVEESLSDVKQMIQERLGISQCSKTFTTGGQHGEGTGAGQVMEWEREWTDEVQKVLEMDAGWGWKGFWECVEENVKNPPYPASNRHSDPNGPESYASDAASPLSESGEEAADRARTRAAPFVREVMSQYQARREWDTLPDVRAVVQRIEREYL